MHLKGRKAAAHVRLEGLKEAQCLRGKKRIEEAWLKHVEILFFVFFAVELLLVMRFEFFGGDWEKKREGEGCKLIDLALVSQQKQSRHEPRIFFTCRFISSFVPEWGSKGTGKWRKRIERQLC